MTKRILIVGSWGTTHVRRFLSVLCREKDSDLIIDSFDPRFDDNQGNECGADNVYRVQVSDLQRYFFKIRKLGTFFFMKECLKRFEQVVSTNHYDLVNIHFLPFNVESYVNIAHKHSTPIMLTPLGSDVLRVNKRYLPSINRAFDKAEYVSANFITGFCSKVKEKFQITENKMVNLGYGSETLSAMLEMKGKYTREQYAAMLNLPESSFYICCGYTASIAQRHSVMIDAVNKNRHLLPKDYCLLIPLSYGPAKEQLKEELSNQCESLGLNYFLITDYLSNEQVAALRYVSDLMFHIQPTDAYNSSLQEFLLGETMVINGKWLDYPSLERHGYPYYICDSLEALSECLNKVLTSQYQKPLLHQEIQEEIISNSWICKIQNWILFYKNCFVQ